MTPKATMTSEVGMYVAQLGIQPWEDQPKWTKPREDIMYFLSVKFSWNQNDAVLEKKLNIWYKHTPLQFNKNSLKQILKWIAYFKYSYRTHIRS